ncbi:MAG: hydrogenase maturation nickel metallochaperone HypA [Pseudodesulfovibrio sp.]
MHEMSIVQSIFGILREEMVKHDGKRLKKVTIKNGALAGIVTESLKFAWDALIPDGEFDGAELEIIEIPIKVACGECGEEFEPEHTRCMPCPKCELLIGHTVLQGKEMLIDSIEVDDIDC